MSIPSAKEAIRLAKEAALTRERQIQDEIDQDIQALVSLTSQCITTDLPDKKGYYTFKVSNLDIKYDNHNTVLNQFLKAMQEQEYVIQIEHHKSLLRRNSYYLVKFRPDPENE